jgi:ADP-ribose pyrophosphatase YjhB (NUDIX family)
MTDPRWLEWAQRLQAIAQSGIAYCQNPFDIERYEQIREIAAEILADHTGGDLPEVRDLFTGQTGYATPKVDARGVVFRGDQILLVKELADGGWTLPGGWVDILEPPSLAVEREVFEESGYRVKAVKLLALFDRRLHDHPPHFFSIYKLFFGCELLGGSPVDSIETAGAAFYSRDNIPPLSVARTTLEELDRLFLHHAQPDRPTDFD